MAIGVLLLFVYVIFLFFIIEKIYKGDAFFLLLYIIFFIPFYSVFQLIILKTTQNIFLIELIKKHPKRVLFKTNNFNKNKTLVRVSTHAVFMYV